MNTELLRKLPKVDELLQEESIVRITCTMPRRQALKAVRAALENLRQRILQDASFDAALLQRHRIVEAVALEIACSKKRSLRRVINGTGVVLHTNLGRAKLSRVAAAAAMEAACGYSTLEYDPKQGQRGSRHSHIEKIICDIAGCEAAMAVNNNAAATMLCLAAMGCGKEIIVSRGELVEIGGSFRVPEIMEQSGAILKEVGTTNKTRISDYEAAIGERTGALMKVHTSNYRIIGFTEEASLSELSALGRARGLPLIYDMGSGLMVDVSAFGIKEPTVKESLAAGTDVLLFSGDKLLGGPQCGLIIGKKEYIQKMKKHPLARVLRVDKMTLAAMEETFRTYYDEARALVEIPVLAMLTREQEALKREAQALAEAVAAACKDFDVQVVPAEGMVGGGSAPGTTLWGWAVALCSSGCPVAQLEQRLRSGEPPIVGRIAKEKVLLDVRTLTPEDYPVIVRRLLEIEQGSD